MANALWRAPGARRTAALRGNPLDWGWLRSAAWAAAAFLALKVGAEVV